MIAEALASPGMCWLVLAALMAGLVRGFAGFGTAMVFMPVAARVTDPVSAVLILTMMDLFGPLMVVPRVLKQAHLPDLGRLGLGMALGIPLGVAALVRIDAEGFRLVVSLLTLGLLGLLAAGLRYRGALKPPLVVAIGGIGGILGGATTLFGPPVILFYMASTLPAVRIRANLTLYLICADAAFMAILWLNGVLALAPMLIGAALVVPYGLANLAGAAIFRPEAVGSYRAVAYVIIAASALSGLPLFG